MEFADRLDLLRQALPDVLIEQAASVDQPCLVVPASAIAEVAHALRTHPGLQYHVLAELTAVDLWPVEPRFEVVYHFVGLGVHALGEAQAAAPARLRVKARVHGDTPALPTICDVYPNANWYEREVYDLFGVLFNGHPDLRRILMPDEWDGHPARKDYPVQIKLPVDTGMPLQVTEEEFLRNVARQREIVPPHDRAN
jgi:NADH-quinone oxidoreductase subunit C